MTGTPSFRGHRNMAAAERFWPKVEKTATCWLWRASFNRNGYGQFGIGGAKGMMPAHRWAYEAIVGPIPAGLTLDHLCRVRHCVNPAHLEPVTNRENILRGTAFSAVHARKTHCPRGHQYTEENTRRSKDGARCCRACSYGARRHDKAACPSGHPRTPENTRRDGRGYPACKICLNAVARRAYRNRKNRKAQVA